MPPPADEIQLVRFDWAIKTILRDKANFDVLEGFLSALLNEDITIEQLLESESNAEENLKFNRVDILVHDKQGRKIIVEIQNQRETDYLERLLFGVSKLIVDHMPLGESYRNIVKVISISILYYNIGTGKDYIYHGVTSFTGLHTDENLLVRKRVLEGSKFKYYPKNIYPEYYLINIQRFEDIIQSPLDEWIYLLKHSAIRSNFTARNITNAADKLALLKMDPQERRRYEHFVTSAVIERDVIETAWSEGLSKGLTEGRAEGRAEGLEEGRTKGLEEGRTKGLEEGRTEGRTEGEILLFKHLLIKRFGPLPAWAEGTIAHATGVQIKRWSEEIFSAETLAQLLGNSN
jgi:predicted transposase/invertase (TIGR01784 family)